MGSDEHFPLPDVDWPPAAPFWAGAARGVLVMPRCTTCGTLNACGESRCRRCDASTFAWEELSGNGTLFSWTVVRRPFLPQFAEMVPFVTGLVALAEDPHVRLATRVVDADPGQLTVDMPVTVVFRPLRFPGVEREVPAPLFTPAATTSR
jgi:hypothetical protein